MLIQALAGFSQNSDTLPAPVKADTLVVVDSLKKPAANKSAFDSKIEYDAEDSIRFDVIEQKMYLFGKASVKYQDMLLKSAYIEFDMTQNIAYSRGARDSTGSVVLDSAGYPIGDPIFKEGGKEFEAREITYNFKTKKGKIREVTTQEGDAFIHAKHAKKDTGEVYYVKNGKYTTCDLLHPHFYLNATKLKIIPDDKIICGPAYLAVGDVPTPLGLPFGVFPNKRGRKSGVLIPAYGESDLGFFLKDGGYYLGISDYFDLALRGDLYSKGSFGIRSNSNYNRRYRYGGFLGLSFAQIQVGEPDYPDYTKSQDYFVRWTHAQDPKASPNSRFTANVNAGTSTYQTYNSNTANDYLSNSLQSNAAWFRSWQGKPYNLTVNMAHSQNTQTKQVDLTLPEAAFNVARRYPFKRKESVGRPKVYEKIGIGFSMNAKNQVSTYDSIFFENSTVERMRNGLKASIPISTSMNAGPVIITPSVGANAYGYFQSYYKYFNRDSNMVYTDTISGFKYAYDYNASLAFSTRLYAFYSYKNAKIKAFRHVMTPGLSFSYRPDFGRGYGYYGYHHTDTMGGAQMYSIFQNGVYGYPAAGKSGFVNFSLGNNLEMKLKPAKKDTSGQDRKVVLMDFFSINTSYNMAADSMNWSVISLSGRTSLFKKVDITMSGILDQYHYDTLYKKRIDTLQREINGRLFTMTSAALSISTSLRHIGKKEKTQPVKKRRRPDTYYDELNYVLNNPGYYVDFNVPWDFMVFYNLVYSKPALRDTFIQSLSFSGNVNVTKKWKIGFNSGFDFIKRDFTFTSFDIYRDLHCWEMRLNWIPFGFRKSYMLSVAVKASVLQDLKLSRTRNWYDYN